MQSLIQTKAIYVIYQKNILNRMSLKLSQFTRRIITVFQNRFDISLLFQLCIQMYRKQPQMVRKRYGNLFGMLQLYQARAIQYLKEQSMLESEINILQDCLNHSLPVLYYLDIDDLIKMRQLLSRWKKTVQLCLSFLKETAQKAWKQLKTRLIAHISKYYNLIQQFLRCFFSKNSQLRNKKATANSNHTPSKVDNQKQIEEYQRWQIFAGGQDAKQQNQHHSTHGSDVFTYKANSITLWQKQKRSPVKISTPKKGQKKEIRSQYVSNVQLLSQKIKEIVTQTQLSAKPTTFHKSINQKDSLPSYKPESDIENTVSDQKIETNIKKPGKSVGRHKSNIQAQINVKSVMQKQAFKSSSKLDEATIFTTNPYQSSTQITYSSNSRTILKSGKNTGKNSLSKHRMSKNTFRKSLIQKLQIRKGSQHKVNYAALSREELQQIDESKQNNSASDPTGNNQKTENATQININTQNQDMLIKRSNQKDRYADGFCSSKSFKNLKYRRRVGQSNNVTNSLRSLDKIQSFLSGVSREQIKKIKNQIRPSFFRNQATNVDQKNKTTKHKISKMAAIKLKMFDKNQREHQEFINDTELEIRKQVNTLPRRIQTESNQSNYTNTAGIKQFYQVLSEINLNEQNQYNRHPDYFHQLYKRKYSNNENVFNCDSDTRPKPFMIKMEAETPEDILNRANTKKEDFYFDFMHCTIKTHQALTLGQRGLSQCY